MSFPKIIHSFAPANENDWHECWRPCYDSWFKHFDSREFQFRMWTHEACDKFVEKEFPEYLSFYESLPLRIMKVDISRLLVLYKFGGIYHDMDVMCYDNFFNYLNKHSSKFFIVKSNNTLVEYISNCLMASVPSNDLLLTCVELSKKVISSCMDIDSNFYEKLIKDPDPQVLYLTGPILIQNVMGMFYQNYKFKNTNVIDWYDQNYIKLLSNDLFSSNPNDDTPKKYTMHLSSNSWFNYNNKK